MPTISAIQPATAEFLLSPDGRAAVDALQGAALGDAHAPALLADLRRRLTPAQAGAVLTLARLRQRAAAKFPAAHQLFFTAEALEQATAWPVACQHAAWIDRHAPPGPVLDLGCGIGGDLLALAQRRPVIAYEIDPVRACFAQANAAALGLADRVEVRQQDWVAALQANALPSAAAAFADPARRVEERRIFRLDQMQPPLEPLLALQQRIPLLGVKVMPSVADADLPPACGVEFISHAHVCKEAVLWFGPARWHPKWATVFVGATVVPLAGDTIAPPLGTLAPGNVLYEPDPALIRADCLATLAERYDAHLFDAQIAYLVGPVWKPDGLAQAFAIDEVHPFSLKVLNQRLQALHIGRVELKKRGFPVEPEELRPRLKLVQSGRDGVVLFTRRGDERLMIIGRRLAPTVLERV